MLPGARGALVARTACQAWPCGGWVGEVCWDALEMLDVSSLVKNSSFDFKVGMNLDFLPSTC